jgi:uncharacterized protein (DUF2237 family)
MGRAQLERGLSTVVEGASLCKGWIVSEQLISSQKNVLGGPLLACSYAPLTGFFRTGCCETGRDDLGRHLVCSKVTAAFLAFSRSRGNDLSTPRPELRFPGLKPGDRWCLCVHRWLEAYEAGVAPPVVLAATHRAALEVVSLDILKAHAIDG